MCSLGRSHLLGLVNDGAFIHYTIYIYYMYCVCVCVYILYEYMSYISTYTDGLRLVNDGSAFRYVPLR